MALPETGVRLVAENERGFLNSLKRANTGVEKFEKNTKAASAGTIALGTAVGQLVAGGLMQIGRLAVQAGTAMTGFITDSVSMAADLEAQMSGVAAVLGANEEELAQLNELTLQLGINPNLTVSSLEAAQAIEVLAKNGISLEEIMGGMAEQTIALANATGADFAIAADIATDTMAAFGNQGLMMEDAVNGITSVVNGSKFDINDYALALANGGAVAASVGVEFADFNTAIAAISPSFSSGQTAGTALKNLLLRLEPTTESAKDAMRDLGLITADGANQFFEANGELKGMGEIAGVLAESLGGLSEQQKISTLRTIFGNDAMGAAIALANTGADEFETLAASMALVDAGDSAATRVDNLAGAMDILGGVIEAVRLQIGDAFLPIITEMARKVASFVEENADRFIQFFTQAAAFVSTFVTALLEGQGPIASFTSALATIGVPQETIDSIQETIDKIVTFTSNVITFVTEHSEQFKGALIGIGIALGTLAVIGTITGLIAALINPITLVIAAAALLGVAWRENWGGIQEKTQAVIEFIKPLIENAIAAIKLFWAENGDAILAKTVEIWDLIKEKISLVVTFIKEFWAENGDAILEKAKEIWEAVKEAIETAVNFIKDKIITPIVTAIKEFWAENGDEILANTGKTWQGIKDFINTIVENIKDLVAAFRAAFSGDWKEFGRKLRDIWDRSWNDIKAKVVEFGPIILAKIAEFVTDILAKFGETDWNQIGIDMMEGLKAGIVAGAIGVINAIIDVARAAAEAASGFFEQDSPSKLFMRMGVDVDKGLAVGLLAGKDMITKAAVNAMSAANVIAPPASGGSITNRTINNNSSQTVNFTGNFASQPQITDRGALMRTLAGAG